MHVPRLDPIPTMFLLAESIVTTEKVTLLCYRCGQPGHLKANCPCKSTLPSTVHGQRNTTYSQRGKNQSSDQMMQILNSFQQNFLYRPGKQKTQHEGETCDDTSIFLPSSQSLCDQLTGRTRRAAGMNVSTSILTSVSTLKVHKSLSRLMGPLGED